MIGKNHTERSDIDSPLLCVNVTCRLLSALTKYNECEYRRENKRKGNKIEKHMTTWIDSKLVTTVCPINHQEREFNRPQLATYVFSPSPWWEITPWSRITRHSATTSQMYRRRQHLSCEYSLLLTKFFLLSPFWYRCWFETKMVRDTLMFYLWLDG